MPRILRSSTLQWKLFQLFTPIGGVAFLAVVAGAVFFGVAFLATAGAVADLMFAIKGDAGRFCVL